MCTPSENREYPIIPPGELRCIWMSAGIISYQLCDRKYDCDNCPIDAALRKHEPQQQPKRIQEPSITLKEPETLRKKYFYTTSHTWLQIIGTHKIRLGIEPHIASALLNPKSVVLPSINQSLAKNQLATWIILVDGTLPIMSPIDGEVIAVNTTLIEHPEYVNNYPFDSGWLFEIEFKKSQFISSQFHGFRKAQEVYNKDSLRFTVALSKAMKEVSPSIGTTLADGGMPLRDISSILGQKKYFDIVRHVLSSKIAY